MILLALSAVAVGILALGIFIGVWMSGEHGPDPWQQFTETCEVLFSRRP